MIRPVGTPTKQNSIHRLLVRNAIQRLQRRNRLFRIAVKRKMRALPFQRFSVLVESSLKNKAMEHRPFVRILLIIQDQDISAE